jgi:hypothetical protein
MKSVAAFKSNTSQAICLPKDVALPESTKRGKQCNAKIHAGYQYRDLQDEETAGIGSCSV